MKALDDIIANMSETNYIGVQFKPIGKTYSFLLPEGLEVKKDTLVVVNTVRGKQIGRVATVNLPQPENPTEVQPIERIANEEDLKRKAEITVKEQEVVVAVAKYLRDPGHEGIKAVDAEYSLDYSRLTIYLNYETTTDFNPRNLSAITHMFKDCRMKCARLVPEMQPNAQGLILRLKNAAVPGPDRIQFNSIKMAKSQTFPDANGDNGLDGCAAAWLMSMKCTRKPAPSCPRKRSR